MCDGEPHHEEINQRLSGVCSVTGTDSVWYHSKEETPLCPDMERLPTHSQGGEDRLLGSHVITDASTVFFYPNGHPDEEDRVRVSDPLLCSSPCRSGKQSGCDYQMFGSHHIERYSQSEVFRSVETHLDPNRHDLVDFLSGLHTNSVRTISTHNSPVNLTLRSVSEQLPTAERVTVSHDLSPVSILGGEGQTQGAACASSCEVALGLTVQTSGQSVLTCTPGAGFEMAKFLSTSEPGTPRFSATSLDGVHYAQNFAPTLSGIVLCDGQRRGGHDDGGHNSTRQRTSGIVFILYGIFLSSIIQVTFLALSNFHQGEIRLCNDNGKCPCRLTQTLIFIVTYGLHVYIPFSLLAPTLFFITIHSMIEEVEQRRQLARMHYYVTSDNISQNVPVDATSGGSLDGDDETEAGPVLRWGVPHVFSTLSSNVTFWFIVLVRFCSFSLLDTRLVRSDRVALLHDAGLVLALSAPLAVVAKYKGHLSLAIPFMLLDAFPLLSPTVLTPIKLNRGMEHILHPLLLIVIERLFWYVSAATMPRATPVGVKITLSSSFAAMYILFVLTSTICLPYEWWVVICAVMAVEIFVIEMLFNTLLLEFIGLRLLYAVLSRVWDRLSATFSVEVSDPINISTQVRWPALALAMCGVSPLFWLQRWDRVLVQNYCDGLIPKEVRIFMLPFSFALVAFLLSHLLTTVIRMNHGRLRAPLIICDWFVALLWGWYVICTVPFVLSAVM